MSSSSVLCVAILLIFDPWVRGSKPSQSAPNELTCPETISVQESTTPPAGWVASSRTVERTFERISLYELGPNGAKFDLAPDDEKHAKTKISQVWHLPGERSNHTVIMACRYRNSGAMLEIQIPSTIQECALNYVSDARGVVTGASKAYCN